MNTDLSITLKCRNLQKEGVITLPSSKSISNRALIVKALCSTPSTLYNLSEARDTQTMIALLKDDNDVWDVKDAGTTMRFLTAFATITHQKKILTGTPRMQKRPIKILVDALRQLGAEIDYKAQEGYPPVEIKSFEQKINHLSIRGDISSQYISALLMIAPALPKGLTLTLEGTIGSRPYIEMTLAIMQRFGVSHTWDNSTITIAPQPYSSTELIVEPDWSAASYWYSFVALSNNSTVMLQGLTENSLQGDSILVKFMTQLGVSTTFNDEGALLSKCDHQSSFEYDFTDCPDLAQTIAVLCAVKKIKVKFTGLESLKIKETDRVLALQNELSKIGASLIEKDETWHLTPSEKLPPAVKINTYEDHRMAMAFAPLCLVMDVSFDDKTVVRKSYPRFWEDVASTGLFQ